MKFYTSFEWDTQEFSCKEKKKEEEEEKKETCLEFLKYSTGFQNQQL